MATRVYAVVVAVVVCVIVAQRMFLDARVCGKGSNFNSLNSERRMELLTNGMETIRVIVVGCEVIVVSVVQNAFPSHWTVV